MVCTASLTNQDGIRTALHSQLMGAYPFFSHFYEGIEDSQVESYLDRSILP